MADRSSSRNGAEGELPGWLKAEMRDVFSGASVLLVEDDPDIRELMSTLLTLAGFETTACATAEAALEELREQPFDLVLTDYMLPTRTGAWLLQQASNEGLIDATPALIVTAHPDAADVRGYDVIPKPFDLEELVSTVKRHLSGGTSRRPKLPMSAPILSSGARDGRDGGGREPIDLVLYVSAHSPRSAHAIKNIKSVLARFESSRVKLTICDLSQDPHQGLADAVAFTPTLVKRSPGPRTFILGHIANPEILVEILEAYSDQS
jgi:DNA-binding response OmpR family regulator